MRDAARVFATFSLCHALRSAFLIPHRLSPLSLSALLLALLVAMPVLSVLFNLLQGGTGGTWAHMASTVLPEYIASTLWLCLWVGLGTALVGVSTAWASVMWEFPGRRVFDWALVLPLATPAYVMAYTYTDLLQFVGPVQTALRETFGWERGDYWFPDVRTTGGAAFMFIAVLYPYVYLLTRQSLIERAGGLNDAARMLGQGAWAAFFRVSLPLARPAIAAGVALALMETLADYGTVSYFGVQTFTTGIYRAWFSLGDRVAAAQLAALLLAFVASLLLAERLSRGGARFHDGSRAGASSRRHVLPRRIGWVVSAACLVPLSVGFIVPGVVLLNWAFAEGDAQFGERFLHLAANSFTLAAVASVCAVALALLLAYAARTSRSRIVRAARSVVGLGYAVPGAVIAVGILIPVTRLDHLLSGLWLQWTGSNPGLVLTGGISALIYAYLARFLTVSLQSVESGLSRITPSMDEAARSLGLNASQTLRRVHWPMLRGSLLTAALLVFVDVMKELPATLVMRPFNFDTLATQAYTLASDERLHEASTAALAIVVVGLLPLIALSRQIARSRRD
ncbi:MAG: iron ABC transporter permease [Gammaproteobacteria bacterium]|jgi:iron(III) transport system permease protein|nr:iron ABC transporter permease [Gammaproteobacteria bacterium]MBU0771422.1 iron ABC transporter permease [Gammaproteobacteria bacterium]MBU0854755.1 iron ABC transporter permease [Gammaproteobacteria bacterium]MBU1846890.1 iron ABC transporter permease [Gammaproteobacteria bacterium]